MPMLEERMTLHIPPLCSRRWLLQPALHDEKPTAFLCPDVHDAELVTFEVDGCEITAKTGVKEACQEMLATPLSPEVECWAPLFGGTSWLPIDTMLMWRVLPAGSEMPVVLNTPCVRVMFEDETSLARLFCNAWRYTFDIETGTFVRAADPQRNAVKALLREAVISRSGGTDDRIADYGRLVLFLLSKVSLTEEERAMLAPVLAYAPQASELSGVIAREKSVQKLVVETKKDPLGFIDWNGDWNNPWWNAAPDANTEGTEGETA